MDNILFITQPLEGKPCGIGFIGKLIGEMLLKSKQYNVEILYGDNNIQLENLILKNNPQIILYNHHDQTTPWIRDESIRNKYPHIKHVMMHHDVNQGFIDNYNPSNNNNFKYLISPDPTLRRSDFIFTVNRLMPSYNTGPYIEKKIPIIGFQGFGARHKGIHKIVQTVKDEFTEAIIRLHIPPAYYGSSLSEAYTRVAEAQNIIGDNPNIKIVASHDILTTNQVIQLLSQNTINCYFNDYLDGAGLASSPDYALAAKRPIAVTKSHQLRNFNTISPSICIEDNTLKTIISFGIGPLQKLHSDYSEQNVLKDYEKTFGEILAI